MKKYYSDSDFFSSIDTEEKAYWLGFISADGSIGSHNNSISIELNAKDIKHLYKFAEAIKTDAPVKLRNTRTNVCTINISSLQMKEDLKTLGCIPNKTYKETWTPPKVPNELMRHYLRGYFDGDGCIYIRKSNNFELSFTGRLPALAMLSTILVLYGFQFKYRILKNSETGQLVLYKKTECIRFLNFIYSDSTVFLDRKKEKILSVLSTDSIENRRRPA